jgi:hypothetical protein
VRPAARHVTFRPSSPLSTAAEELGRLRLDGSRFGETVAIQAALGQFTLHAYACQPAGDIRQLTGRAVASAHRTAVFFYPARRPSRRLLGGRRPPLLRVRLPLLVQPLEQVGHQQGDRDGHTQPQHKQPHHRCYFQPDVQSRQRLQERYKVTLCTKPYFTLSCRLTAVYGVFHPFESLVVWP